MLRRSIGESNYLGTYVEECWAQEDMWYTTIGGAPCTMVLQEITAICMGPHHVFLMYNSEKFPLFLNNSLHLVSLHHANAPIIAPFVWLPLTLPCTFYSPLFFHFQCLLFSSLSLAWILVQHGVRKPHFHLVLE